MQRTEFCIVGGGWRTLFYLRIARALPERYDIQGLVVRDPAKGRALEEAWGVRTYRTLDELLTATNPQFVVTSVAWDANPPLLEALAAHDIPTLSETPPAPDLAALHWVWALVERGARIHVAEQYIYQPHHSARLTLAHSGALGTVSEAQVSAAHGYHGLSLIRHYLGAGFENVRITARAFRAPLLAGPDRTGPPQQERIEVSEQVIAWLEFPGQLGVYDFCGEQYFSWVRSQRLLVRGDRGEIVDMRASYLPTYREPIHVTFQREMAGAEGNLEGFYLKGIIAGEHWVYRNAFAPAPLTDDEIAIAAALDRMGAYARGEGEGPYPLAEACQDRYLDILISQAVQTGSSVQSETQPWAHSG